MKYLFDCRATSLCTAKILFNPFSFSELFRSYFAVFSEAFRKFGVGVSQCPIRLNASVKRGYDILHRPWRHPENFRYARGVDVANMEKFGYHVPGIDNLGLARFRQNRIFRHVKLIGDDFDNIIGEFCNLWHNTIIFARG